MRIGIDIDGVLNYRTRFVLECGTRFCAETGKGSLQNLTSVHIGEVYGWDKTTRDEFWDKYGALQTFVWPAQNYAAEVIEGLKAEGHEIWIVTGRNEGDPRVEGMPEGMNWEEVTRRWLAENNIRHDEFGFNQHDKGKFCREHDIDVMIEDNPEYLETFNNETKVLIFDQPYNREVVLENSERVYSWYDIYAKLRGMAR